MTVLEILSFQYIPVMWINETVIPQLRRPFVDAGTRFFNVKVIREDLGLDMAASTELEELIYNSSNLQVSLYVSFIAHCLTNKCELADMDDFIRSGDKSQAILEDHVRRRQQILDEIIQARFECDVHHSTKRCPNPKCRRVGDMATVARQTRSADEGMVPKLLCNGCGSVFNA